MGEWRDIESAPKDRRVILFYPECEFSKSRMVFGEWNNDYYAKTPRPYWTNDRERLLGVVECRKFPPAMWMELEPPKDGK